MYDASVYGEKFMNNEKKLFSIGRSDKWNFFFIKNMCQAIHVDSK